MTTTLASIETSAKTYAEARASLAEIVAAMNDGIEALKREHLPALKRAVTRAAARHDELKALIDDAPDLFVKPRTIIFHGVKLGYQKGKGGIAFDDATQVVKLIRRHLPEQADVLIAVKEAPAKDALAQLSAADLKRIGCTVIETGDAVVIKPTDSEVDKMVDALLKDATEADA
ncbi:host-nuclease inhibitor Gam family protein [Ralstonia syzygii subsp. celebesensis]|uniref:Uncharacterized protein n=2 Tax=Ralstonia syzygii subsp. celebesensis TaxID=1310168 RepID=A0A1U9VJ60_9RALS|nr:host-nuclease inhibitor Gam family protein [Ralstonia syzygii]AQW30515.1 hypothetical protein B0B51_11450 [blood disease bacterium A2-HR MARDI]QQV55658.1 host-nuclease inhibitor Gam family protein [Ralstonia syzygii subsp. celebesensis]CCA81110.1 conserved hypothetical protein [blood disease bacterium R229]